MFDHRKIENNGMAMAILTTIVVSIGGIVEIVPLFFIKDTVPDLEGVKPYTALALEGRDIYIREGCVGCHSQMIRPFRTETERYGAYSKPAESRYDHPHLWGSKRTGPDLARLGGKYPDSWHTAHMKDPRAMVPESVMPSYPWLETTPLDTRDTQTKMRVMHTLGVPYTEAEIHHAAVDVAGKTELDALIAYLQSLGTAVKKDASR
ncbi:MAG: cytochrome-c oxidase, cbb3-type subunit II [Candidatus Sericytochromatia bacterium]|nr:cytochrome-c oxidase, cbb3-type subunit II [Candidatus Sericytochromatia bacterium]